jgi:hypothetical protein
MVWGRLEGWTLYTWQMLGAHVGGEGRRDSVYHDVTGSKVCMKTAPHVGGYSRWLGGAVVRLHMSIELTGIQLRYASTQRVSVASP